MLYPAELRARLSLVEGTIGATFRIVIPDRPVELISVRNERAMA